MVVCATRSCCCTMYRYVVCSRQYIHYTALLIIAATTKKQYQYSNLMLFYTLHMYFIRAADVGNTVLRTDQQQQQTNKNSGIMETPPHTVVIWIQQSMPTAITMYVLPLERWRQQTVNKPPPFAAAAAAAAYRIG